MTAAIPIGDRRVTPARYVELIVTLAARTLKVRYRGSFLGVYWSLSNPLLMTGVYTLIFGTAFSRSYGGSVQKYMLAVFVALTVMAFFSAATTQALSSVVSSGPLLNKVELPFSIFPLSFVAANVFQLAVGTIPLLVIVTAFQTRSVVHVIALIGPLLGLILTSVGFSLATSALYVFFRDLPYLYELFTFVLYMTTPIFYPASLIPESVRPWLVANPLSAIVESTRVVTLGSAPLSLATVAGPVGAGLVTLAVGAVVFAVLRNDFMDLL